MVTDIKVAEPQKAAAAKGEGRYVYCIADTGDSVSLGGIGLGGNEVYTVPFQDICAVVHDCSAEPYKSDVQEKVRDWVMTHQAVVDAAWNRWGAVLPSSFDVIVRGEAEADAGRCVRRWLEQDYERLKRKMLIIREKAEYGVQVFWDPKAIARSIAETSPEVKKLEEEVRSRPRGLAYMYRQRLESLLRREMEVGADRCFKECYARIKQHVDDIRVEKTQRTETDSRMILNLSCLVLRNKYTELGEELDSINQMAGLSVRFTGPWPPYSFVG
ncbi:MAG: GvpL/GvpF family gas vesicle protein [Dehalococcoidia bacterium]|nr:GvpL/GvpF family gas vesicle protein [Dehalococcoidia bacterium]